MVFLRYGAGEGGKLQSFFYCIIQRTKYGLSTRGVHSTLTVLLCFNYVKVTYCECLFLNHHRSYLIFDLHRTIFNRRLEEALGSSGWEEKRELAVQIRTEAAHRAE